MTRHVIIGAGRVAAGAAGVIADLAVSADAGWRYTVFMVRSRSGWQDPDLVPPAADELAPLPRSALLPLAAGLLIIVIIAIEHPAGWLAGLDTGALITMPLAGGLTWMFGGWNLSGPSRRRWNWAARYRRRQRARRRNDDLRIVRAKGQITQISGEPAAVAGGEVIPARPGSPPLPPPGVYHLRWLEPADTVGQPQLLSARPVRRGSDSRWLALIGAVLFGWYAGCTLIVMRHVLPLDGGGAFALAFYFLIATGGFAVPAWLLAAEWRYLMRHDDQ